MECPQCNKFYTDKELSNFIDRSNYKHDSCIKCDCDGILAIINRNRLSTTELSIENTKNG